MVNYFRDLPFKQKIGFVCFVIAALGFAVTFTMGLVKSGTPDPVPTESTQASSPVSTSPSATPSVDPTPSTSPTQTTPSEMPEIKYGENKISVAEIRSLQDVANKGIIEFLTWNAGETLEARKSRIAPYFASDAAPLELAPDLQKASRYSSESESAGIVSLGSVDYLNPVGGDEASYRLTIGTVLRAQYNYSGTGAEKSSVVKTSRTIALDMTKESGAWKIKALSEE